MNEKKALSYGMLISSMLIFGTIGIFRRYIPLSSGLLACFRGLIGALCLLLFCKFSGRKTGHVIEKRKLWILILSGMVMGVNWMLLFEAYHYTTVATATLCYYMQPTIVILLSPFLFKEKLPPQKLACALIAIAGMVLVSGMTERGSIGRSDWKGIFFGLGAAAFYAGVVILNKKAPVEDAYQKTILQLFSAATIMLPYLLLTEDFRALSFTPLSVVMLLIVGVVHTGIAYALYFGSMNGLKAQSIALLSYIDPVSALILSAIILREGMTLSGVIGAVLIIGSALCSEVSLGRKSFRFH